MPDSSTTAPIDLPATSPEPLSVGQPIRFDIVARTLRLPRVPDW